MIERIGPGGRAATITLVELVDEYIAYIAWSLWLVSAGLVLLFD